MSVTYAKNASTLSLSLNGTGFLYLASDEVSLIASVGAPRARVTTQALRWTIPSVYQSIGAGYTMADLNASHRFSKSVEGIVQIKNLTDFYQNDRDAGFANAGRQSKAGIRIKL